MKTNEFIPSVNFHLWEPCNMRCKFCFATFQDVKQTILPKGHLPEVDAINVVRKIAASGFKKITFAGGEPLLCPWLPELIRTAKQLGMTTMIVTNGSRLTESFLIQNKEYLDWIALSIDSLNKEANLKIGRAIVGKRALSESFYYEKVSLVKSYDYNLKINTVVNAYNYRDDFNDFIDFAKPKRWKLLQVLPIKGQNDAKVDVYLIDNKKFASFLEKHKAINCLVPETNNDIKGSYVMIDPAGRFFSNSEGRHNYSKPILKIGVKRALGEMDYSFEKFLKRGGDYNWLLI